MSLFDFRNRRRKKPRSRWLGPALKRLFLPGAAVVAVFAAYVAYDLPSIDKLAQFKKTPSVIVKAEDGTILGTFGDVYGDYVPYNQLPKYLIQAVVATEDRNFFYHFGVDPLGLIRAVFVNLRAHRVVQGGSTITQQLAKNVFLTPERTLRRKFQEMILAFELEYRFSKEDILTIYLNRVYMGAGNYGVDAASRRYFSHSVREISLNEAAMLVGLLKAPSRYAPTSNPDLSEKRAHQVLLNMVDANYIKPAEVEMAKAQLKETDAAYRDVHGFGAFYFSDWVVGQLPEYIGESQGDVVVITTLKPLLQHMAEDAVDKVLAERGTALKASQGALLAMEPDGAIRAMVGGRNYRASQFNRVTQAIRQPGSSFKTFVYLAGLEAGYTPDSQMEDKPIEVGTWRPKDYSGEYKGMMTMRDAFAESINSIAVQISESIGREHVVEMAQRLGITTEMNPDPSIALGSNEVTLFDMTKAYAHMASGGSSVYPYAIKRVETADGKVLYERTSSGTGQVLRSATVGMMNDMLMAVTTMGTGRGAAIGRPVAGKTGTTSDYRDAWFIGFTPQLVAGVWVGNDDTGSMKKVTGGSLPASIWREFMAPAMKGLPAASIPSQTSDSGWSGLTGRSGSGFLPWLFDGEQGGAKPSLPSSPSPHSLQAVPGGAIPQPMQHPLNNTRGKNIRPGSPAPIPEDEPTPEYDAPPSFWDTLTGDEEKKQ